MTLPPNKRVIISGGSRGIGLAIAKRLASEGAKVAILAKTAEPHPSFRARFTLQRKKLRQPVERHYPFLRM